MTHGEGDAACARVHALHVHVGPEYPDGAGGALVRLHALEDRLRVVQHGRTGVERKGPVLGWVST